MQQMMEGRKAVEESKHFIRSFVIQDGAGIGIDMGHHKIDVGLVEGIKRGALREEEADKLMIAFYCTFLVGSTRIAVKDMSAK